MMRPTAAGGGSGRQLKAGKASSHPARFQLLINLKGAKALAYQVLAGLVLRAEEVIE
jgi:hypothetical protein